MRLVAPGKSPASPTPIASPLPPAAQTMRATPLLPPGLGLPTSFAIEPARPQQGRIDFIDVTGYSRTKTSLANACAGQLANSLLDPIHLCQQTTKQPVKRVFVGSIVASLWRDRLQLVQHEQAPSKLHPHPSENQSVRHILTSKKHAGSNLPSLPAGTVDLF